MANTTTNHENLRSTTDIEIQLTSVCEEYSSLRIKHDLAVENGDEISVETLKKLGELNTKCEELTKEYALSAREEFYSRCHKAENSLKEAFVIYTYDVLKCKDEVVSKNDDTFARRTTTTKPVVFNIYDFEKHFEIDSKKISEQKAFVSKLGRELLTRVSKDLGVYKNVVSTLADESKKASEIELDKKLEVALAQVVSALYYEDDGNGSNALAVDKTDVAYLKNAFTRKGKEALSIQVLKDGQLVFVLQDMIHKALTGGGYTVTGYKTKK